MKWQRKIGDNNDRFNFGDGGANWLYVVAGTDLRNELGFQWIGLPPGSYQTVPDRPNQLVDAKGNIYVAGENYKGKHSKEMKKVSTAAEIARERREARERERVEAAYAKWDEWAGREDLDLNCYLDRTEEEKTYVFVLDRKFSFVGRGGWLVMEDFFAKMIEREMTPADLAQVRWEQ